MTTATLALMGCGSGSTGQGTGTGGATSAASGGRSSQSTSTGGTAAASSGTGSTSGGTGGQAGVAGNSGQDASVGTGGSGGTGSARGGATGTAPSGGKIGSGGSSPGGSPGAGGDPGAGGSLGNRDASDRDSAGANGGATDGGAAGKTGSGGTAGGITTSPGTGGSGGSGAGGTAAFTACPGATQTLTVGSGQQYATVQAAVNAVSSNNSKLVQISVKAGKYKEQVTINKPFVCLTGESATTTTITNALGTNIVTGGTVIVTGNDFSAANIAFENTGGDGSGQAVAFMAQGQRQQFRDCRFLSYQDTLYTNTGTQYFRDCYIQGDTDYIFGDATAVFDNCTMNNVAEGTAVTAPRTPQNTTYGFVFLGGQLTANATTSTVRSNHVALGRPWGPYAAAAFINVAMGAHILADGWTTMSNNTLAETRFWEYKSTGTGANPTNATRSSRQLSDSQAQSYTLAKALPSWTPGYSQ